MIGILIVITVIVVLFALFGGNKDNFSLLMDGSLSGQDRVDFRFNRNVGFNENSRFLNQNQGIEIDACCVSQGNGQNNGNVVVPVVKIKKITAKGSNGTDYGNLCVNPSTHPPSLLTAKGCPQVWYYDGNSGSIYAEISKVKYYLSTGVALTNDNTYPIALGTVGDRLWKIKGGNGDIESLNVTEIKHGFGGGYIDVIGQDKLILRG